MNEEREQVSVPSTMYELLELALADLKKTEQMSDKYDIEMSDWHRYDKEKDKCQVCLAGCVLAQTLGLSHRLNYLDISGSEMPKDWDRAMNTLEELRTGHIPFAYEYFSGMFDESLKTFNIIHYDDDPEAFKKGMEEIITYLKQENL